MTSHPRGWNNKTEDTKTFGRKRPDPSKPYISAHCNAGTCKHCTVLKCTHECHGRIQ